MQIKRIVNKPGFSLGSLDSLAIGVWESEPQELDTQEAVHLLETLARKNSNIELLAVLGPNCRLPGERVRELMGDGLRALSSQVAVVGQVIEGGGFRSAALRGAITGLSMVIRPQYPQRVFPDVPSAAAFLAREGSHRAPSIVQAVATLRSHQPT